MGTPWRFRDTGNARRYSLTQVVLCASFIGFALTGNGCTQFGASHPTNAGASRGPWVAPGKRAHPVSIDSWDIVKGSGRASGFHSGSHRWLRSDILDDVLRYRSDLNLASLNDATYVVVSINPTCGLMKEELVRDLSRLSVWTGPIEGKWSWFCASRSETVERERPILAREGEPFSPFGAEYRLVLRDGYVYAIDRAD